MAYRLWKRNKDLKTGNIGTVEKRICGTPGSAVAQERRRDRERVRIGAGIENKNSAIETLTRQTEQHATWNTKIDTTSNDIHEF